MAQEALKSKQENGSQPVAETKVVARQVGNNSLSRNTQNASIYLPDTKSDAYRFAQQFATSSFCPKIYQNKPADVYLAMAYGAQIGLNPLLAVQNIAVVNGKPSIYGDAMTAIVMGHPETTMYEDGYKADGTAFCRITRRNRTVYREFSEAMAKKAGLWGKDIWAKYPERMLLWRAKGNAIRDLYADVLMGMWSVEEARDMPASYEEELLNVTQEQGEQPVEEVVEQNQKPLGSLLPPQEPPTKPEAKEPQDEKQQDADGSDDIADMFAQGNGQTF